MHREAELDALCYTLRNTDAERDVSEEAADVIEALRAEVEQLKGLAGMTTLESLCDERQALRAEVERLKNKLEASDE